MTSDFRLPQEFSKSSHFDPINNPIVWEYADDTKLISTRLENEINNLEQGVVNKIIKEVSQKVFPEEFDIGHKIDEFHTYKPFKKLIGGIAQDHLLLSDFVLVLEAAHIKMSDKEPLKDFLEKEIPKNLKESIDLKIRNNPEQTLSHNIVLTLLTEQNKISGYLESLTDSLSSLNSADFEILIKELRKPENTNIRNQFEPILKSISAIITFKENFKEKGAINSDAAEETIEKIKNCAPVWNFFISSFLPRFQSEDYKNGYKNSLILSKALFYNISTSTEQKTSILSNIARNIAYRPELWGYGLDREKFLQNIPLETLEGLPLDHGNLFSSLIIAAVDCDNVKLVEKLFTSARKQFSREKFLEIVDKKNRDSLLYLVCTFGDIEHRSEKARLRVVQLLIESGVDPNFYVTNNKPVEWAHAKGLKDISEYLSKVEKDKKKE